jgi:hypothetical protein
MEHVFSCAFASGCEFTTKNKNSVRKKIVHDPYVFADPLPPVLPPPPFCHVVIVGGCVHDFLPARHVPGIAVMRPRISAADLYLWVIVSHGFCIAHNDSRGKVTNFVHAVCG